MGEGRQGSGLVSETTYNVWCVTMGAVSLAAKLLAQR